MPISGKSEVKRLIKLSRRENDVLTLLTESLNRKQIAEKLSISERTVRAYIESARRRFGKADTLGTVVFFVLHGSAILVSARNGSGKNGSYRGGAKKQKLTAS